MFCSVCLVAENVVKGFSKIEEEGKELMKK